MAGLAVAVIMLGWLQVCHAMAYARAHDTHQYVTENFPASTLTLPALVSGLVAVAALYLAFSTIVAFFQPEPKIRCR